MAKTVFTISRCMAGPWNEKSGKTAVPAGAVDQPRSRQPPHLGSAWGKGSVPVVSTSNPAGSALRAKSDCTRNPASKSVKRCVLQEQGRKAPFAISPSTFVGKPLEQTQSASCGFMRDVGPSAGLRPGHRHKRRADWPRSSVARPKERLRGRAPHVRRRHSRLKALLRHRTGRGAEVYR